MVAARLPALLVSLALAGPATAGGAIRIVDQEVQRVAGKNRDDAYLVAKATLRNNSGRDLFAWEADLAWVLASRELLCVTEVAWTGPMRRGERVEVEFRLEGALDCTQGSLPDSPMGRRLAEFDPDFVAISIIDSSADLADPPEIPTYPGFLSPALVAGILSLADDEVRQCLRDSQDLEAMTCGITWVTFDVQPDGTITDVRLTDGCYTDPQPTAQCIQQAFDDLRFPDMEAPLAPVSYPYLNPWKSVRR